MIDIFQTHKISPGAIGYLSIGPLSLWMANLPDEWRILWTHTLDPIDESFEKFSMVNELPEPAGGILRRFGFKDKSDALFLSPRLSDRAMVVRPDKPLFIPAQGKVGFFLSTPLWVAISDAGKGSYLTELPAFRPSDTWFGESSVSGELCYVTKTAARLRMSELPLRHYRAVTNVNIHNLGEAPVFVDRIKVPMKNLSLYRGDSNWFYTDSLDYEWGGDKEIIRMSLKGRPNVEGNHLTLAAEPREKLESNLVVRTVKSLFSS